MFWSAFLGLLALLLRDVVAASAVYRDPDTGLTFASDMVRYYNDKPGITYRFAIPSGVSSYTNFDTVIQIVAPNDVGWAGVAFGASMPRNPLFVSYKANGGQYAVTGSMRWANGHNTPTPYTGATYSVIKAGTKSNGTHWQITAKCTGCTSWTSAEGGSRYLNPNGSNRIAMAMSLTKPSNPNSNTSAIDYHFMHGYWDADLKVGTNSNFATAVLSLQETEAASSR